MRLLHTHKLIFKDFIGEYPRFCILSHTWKEGETTHQDFLRSRQKEDEGHAANDQPPTPGIQKVLAFCGVARKHSFLWAWVDTCCINKESSAELSEAINSMYRWYEWAAVCFVHLDDYNVRDHGWDHLVNCRWFYRGWTLQELLASSSVIFLDTCWHKIGAEADILEHVSEITKISKSTLNGPYGRRKPMEQHSIAERMSWSAARKTTREEDRAYCLLGLFGITMSLQYGEGTNAFVRLQKKILKSSADETIFAWSLRDPSDGHRGFDEPFASSWLNESGDILTGILAREPAFFKDSATVRPAPHRSVPYSITNQGLEFRVFNNAHTGDAIVDVVFPLNCYSEDSKMIAIVFTLDRGRWFRNTSKGLVELEGKSYKHTMSLDHQQWQPFYASLDSPAFSTSKAVSQLAIRSSPMMMRFPQQPWYEVGLLRSLQLDRLEQLVQTNPDLKLGQAAINEARRLEKSNSKSKKRIFGQKTDTVAGEELSAVLGHELYARSLPSDWIAAKDTTMTRKGSFPLRNRD